MAKQPIQDTIQFDLSAEEIVVNDTVKIIAAIIGMIPDDIDEKKLRDSIRALMRKFIETDWQFSNMVRSSDPAGKERITLTATARIPEKENYALERRRDDASRGHELMRITMVTTDTTPTANQIEATQSKLRLAILKKAQSELALINKAIDQQYRIGDVRFNAGVESALANRQAHTALASAKTPYGAGFAGDDESIGNAVKLTMHAVIQLRISVAEHGKSK
jgi:hypothetical protein